MKQQIDRIKILADLMRKINRYDMHPRHIAGVKHHLNPMGVHMLDKELEEQFK